MKKLYRQMLKFIAAVVFLALAPLIVLYAMGYRISSTQVVDPYPIGVLYLESEPSRADVLINGEVIGRTPRAVPNLPPGPVHVKVTKAGYASWEKSLTIEPGKVTEARHIRLFPTDQTATTLLSSVTRFALAPNRQLIATVATDNSLNILDQQGEPITKALALSAAPENLLWSPDSSSIIFETLKRNPEVFNLNTGVRTPLPVNVIGQPATIAWDLRVPSRLMILTTDNNLRAYNVVTESVIQISSDAAAFALSARNIYILHTDQSLTRHNLQGDILETLALREQTKDDIERLIVTPDDSLALQTVSGTVFIVQNQTALSLLDHVTDVAWSPDGQLLFMQQAASALYVYNVSSDNISWLPISTLQLVSRLSRPIHNPQWFAGGRHLIFESEGNILVTDIDTRDRTISATLAAPKTDDATPAVGQNGESLFYVTKNAQGTLDLVRQSLE